MEWFFLPMRRADLNVDPIQSEFFSTEAIDGLTEALVRESIQNSLDASQSGVVKVRFWLSGTENALPPQKVSKYFVGLEQHLAAKGSGLEAVPSLSGGVPFLLIEDFGTRGLLGAPEQERDVPGHKNDFYYFWRNVGRSGKEESDRGRWGLGKNVFPASSTINTFLGFTITNQSPSGLLMGQSVLKVHELEGVRLNPYGYFGEVDSEDGFTLPTADSDLLNAFASDFGIARSSETGLSIVVPFPDADITEKRILAAVIRQYFYPIMSGTLVAIVAANGDETVVNKESLLSLVEQMDAGFREELEPLLKLVTWSLEAKEFIEVAKPPAGTSPKWGDAALAESILTELRPRFEKGERLAFQVPVYVRPQAGSQQESYFRLFVERDLKLESHRPSFIREGLIVSDAVKNKQRGARALVVIDDKPLATFLGDAENPAHTEWQSRSAHFRNRYNYGASTLRYVKDAVPSIVQFLTQSGKEEDRTALIDLFFLPAPPTPEDKRKTEDAKKKPGPDPPLPPHPDPPGAQSLRVSKVNGGFTVQPVKPEFAAAQVRVKMAYEVRRGNAFKRYQPADFELTKSPIQYAVEGTEVIECGLNQIVVGPMSSPFKVTVTGFDPSRDLAVRVNLEE